MGFPVAYTYLEQPKVLSFYVSPSNIWKHRDIALSLHLRFLLGFSCSTILVFSSEICIYCVFGHSLWTPNWVILVQVPLIHFPWPRVDKEVKAQIG